MTAPGTDDELLRVLSAAYDAALPPVPRHLREQVRALRPTLPATGTATVGDELAARRNRYRIDRSLAAAAGAGTRRLAESYTSSDGTLVTEVVENDEAHLVLAVRSTDPTVLYVGLAWTLVDAAGVDSTVHLVTPLALDRGGASVRYDIGSVADTGTVYLEPAEPVAVTAVDEAAVQAAFAQVQTGLSRRAWVRAEALHRAAGDPLADLIHEHLEA